MNFLLGPNGIIIRYIISGGSAAVVDLAFLYFFTDYLHIVYTISVVLAFIIAFVVSFVMQKYWTFQDGGGAGTHKQAAVYFGVQVSNLFLNSFLVYFFVEKVGAWYILAQIVASALIAIMSFFIYRRFIFKI